MLAEIRLVVGKHDQMERSRPDDLLAPRTRVDLLAGRLPDRVSLRLGACRSEPAGAA